MITLDENYRIEFDANNFILKYEKEKTIIKDGEEKKIKSSDEWYYPRLENALYKYVDQASKVSKNASELLESLGRINATIANAMIKEREKL